MKLFRFGTEGNEKPGVCIGGKHYDISSFGEDYDASFFEKDGIERLQAFVESNKNSLKEIEGDFRFAMPSVNPSKVVCVGINYRKHANETKIELPVIPELFMKSPSSLCGANDDIVMPRDSEMTDWEVELAFVITKKAQNVNYADALDTIAGYALFNDLSERNLQFNFGSQWTRGKSLDTYGHYGPYLVTKDEITNPSTLGLGTVVNGVVMQSDNTSNMIFDVCALVENISQYMTLMPGDVVSTGTPGGVGFGHKPPVFLREGDIVEQYVDGLGRSRQLCRRK